jgi:DNA-binding response OmpR family regulator
VDHERHVLVATDADWVFDEVDAALGDPELEVRRVREGRHVLPAIYADLPALVVLDLQLGNMGGMATCLNIRLEEGVDRLPHLPILMLLDREADIFLARRSAADGWLIKPLDAFTLRRAANALLDGGKYTEGVPDDAAEPLLS